MDANDIRVLYKWRFIGFSARRLITLRVRTTVVHCGTIELSFYNNIIIDGRENISQHFRGVFGRTTSGVFRRDIG